MKRREVLLGGLAAAAVPLGAKAGMRIGLGLSPALTQGVGSIPVILPATTIADSALKGSASAYVDLGTMALPAGDWCIGFPSIAVPATSATDFYALSLGTLSDTILADNGALTVGWPGAAANPYFNYGWAAVGKDDAGNVLAPRPVTLFASAQQNGISGPQQAAGVPDAIKRTIFIQKSNGKISYWEVANNTVAMKFNEMPTSFGAILAKAARLGCLGKLALTGFSAITYQRFFRIARALTPYQMEAIASGVDPRAVATFSAGAGDLLYSFPSVPADGATFVDLIQGQTATAHGTFASATSLVPTTVDQNQIRGDVDRYRVFQNNGATTDMPFSGTVYGADGDIYASLINKNNGTVQAGPTKIATSRNGKFSGTLAGVATRLADYRVQFAKFIAGSQVGSTYALGVNYFATGPVISGGGQSLYAQLRSNNSFSISSGTIANNGRSQSTGADDTIQQHYSQGCLQQTGMGYGEGQMAKILGDALGLCNMQMNDAIAGTSIAQWLADAVFNSSLPVGMLTNWLNNIKRYRPKYIIWHQGENSAGVAYADYQIALDQLYAILSGAITWDWRFLILPVDNNFDAVDLNKDVQLQAIRSAQIDWANAKYASGDTKVVLAATVNDILRADTNASDGIHKLAQVGGYGAYAERIAQTILQIEGNQTYSGLGPKITAAHWNGDATIDLTITHNGGTGLQTVGGGAPTGFAASLSNAAPTTGPTFTSPLTISSVAITDATHIRITLSAIPAAAPYIWYQWGEPSFGNTDAAAGLTNAVNDNRSPVINTTRGYPLQPLTAAVFSG